MGSTNDATGWTRCKASGPTGWTGGADLTVGNEFVLHWDKSLQTLKMVCAVIFIHLFI